MKDDLYLKTLDETCEYIIGTSQMVIAKGGKGRAAAGNKKEVGEEREAPEAGGYPVMLQLKSNKTVCDWCEQEVLTPNTKVFTRAIGSQIWEGKCLDCKQKKNIIP